MLERARHPPQRPHRQIDVVMRAEALLKGEDNALIHCGHDPGRDSRKLSTVVITQDRRTRMPVATDVSAIVGDAVIRVRIDKPVDEIVLIAFLSSALQAVCACAKTSPRRRAAGRGGAAESG